MKRRRKALGASSDHHSREAHLALKDLEKARLDLYDTTQRGECSLGPVTRGASAIGAYYAHRDSLPKKMRNQDQAEFSERYAMFKDDMRRFRSKCRIAPVRPLVRESDEAAEKRFKLLELDGQRKRRRR